MKKFFVAIMLIAVAAMAACTPEDEPNNGGNDNGGGNGGGETPEVPTIPTGAVDGTFTINDQGGKVYFSQGNLQYQASTNTFRFAENQWNFIGGSYEVNQTGNVNGSDNCLISNIYSGWIDLFGYGTSGWNGSGYTSFEPWAYSSTSDSFLGEDLTGDYAKADWGVYNAISNGGNQAGLWRTLTKDEWDYIINGRSGNIRYARAQVNGVNGLILVPDGWDNSVYELKNVNSGGNNWDVNTIYQSIWENTLEPAGCVFLPNAGWRSINSVGIRIYETGTNGNYWSSTAYNTSSPHAYRLNVGWQGPGVSASFANNGYAVRLVQDIE